MKRQHKYILLFVPILFWDAFYFLLTKLYNISTTIDRVGGEKIDEFMGEK